MVIVLWLVLDIKGWKAEAERWLRCWPELTGRRCPHCEAVALVGHGRRKRTVHHGAVPGMRWAQCGVWEFEVQRVRCKACRRTHTLLPPFVARYQRHPNRVRQEAMERRAAGASWAQVLVALQGLGVPLGSATSPRRWVAGVQARLAAALDGLRREVARVPDGTPAYGSVAEAGSWQAGAELVRRRMAERGLSWPAEEWLAGANRLADGRWAV